MKSESIAQWCVTLRTRWTVAYQASLFMGFPGRILEWVAIPCFPTQELNQGLPHCRQILYHLNRQGSPKNPGVGTLSLLSGIFLTQGYGVRLGWRVIGRFSGFVVVLAILIAVWEYLIWIFIFLVTSFHFAFSMFQSI